MSIIIENPKLILNNINELLLIGSTNRKHPFHTPVFSNFNKGSVISSRVVVLRKYDSESLKLSFHTDIRSAKISELKYNNNSYFVFYDTKCGLLKILFILSSIFTLLF